MTFRPILVVGLVLLLAACIAAPIRGRTTGKSDVFQRGNTRSDDTRSAIGVLGPVAGSSAPRNRTVARTLRQARLSWQTDDPLWSRQWGMARVRVPQAWTWTRGPGDDLVIAVVDSGIALDHPDLQGRLWRNQYEVPDNGLDDDGNGKVDDVWGWHWYRVWVGPSAGDWAPAEDNNPNDEFGHGTHVAGIIGATEGNGRGIAGLANVRLMALRVLDSAGYGWPEDAAAAIRYAVDNGARIINLSVGWESPSPALANAVTYAQDRGVIVVAAAGNNSGPVVYPAAYPDVIAVTATDEADRFWYGSSRGNAITLAAPGTNIWSLSPDPPPWDVVQRRGTSQAAGFVSGTAALLLSLRPQATEAQVREWLSRGALDVNANGLPGWDPYLGAGRLDAAASVRLAAQGITLTLSAPVTLAVGHPMTITLRATDDSGEPAGSGGRVRWLAMGAVTGQAEQVLRSGTATWVLIPQRKGWASVDARLGPSDGGVRVHARWRVTGGHVLFFPRADKSDTAPDVAATR